MRYRPMRACAHITQMPRGSGFSAHSAVGYEGDFFDFVSLVLDASQTMQANGGCIVLPQRAEASNKTPGIQGTNHERRRGGDTASRLRSQTGAAQGRGLLQRDEARAAHWAHARIRVLRGG